jgi:hypothetical protein
MSPICCGPIRSVPEAAGKDNRIPVVRRGMEAGATPVRDIMVIPGLWMTALCWALGRPIFARGHRVIARSLPYARGALREQGPSRAQDPTRGLASMVRRRRRACRSQAARRDRRRVQHRTTGALASEIEMPPPRALCRRRQAPGSPRADDPREVAAGGSVAREAEPDVRTREPPCARASDGTGRGATHGVPSRRSDKPSIGNPASDRQS